MSYHWSPREHLRIAKHLVKWLALSAPLGVVVGSACAFFLWSLDGVTQLRFDHPWLLFLLPIVGVVIVFVYARWGGKSDGGNNLIMDAIHGSTEGDSAVVVPLRMAPLVLLATLGTHLFGGSAGREGTALQMGGAIASGLGRVLKLDSAGMKILLMAGLAAGFGGVFGTPMAGAVFALEVLTVGSMSYQALIPCLVASVLADWACGAWGIHHTQYAIVTNGLARFDWLLLGKIGVAAMVFGLVSILFAELTHGIGSWMKARVKIAYLRPVLGAAVLMGLVFFLGTRDYLGIGVHAQNVDGVSIVSSFTLGGSDTWSWFWKLLFTAITLGSGFKGGEVTPLFFIGATLGNTLAVLLGAPVDLFAALGFVAVFAGATNTPLACTLMGIELFGSQYSLYLMIACFVAYVVSGRSGIYRSQKHMAA